MEPPQKPADKPKQLKADTRQWKSGRVKFAVVGWEGRPDDNYIVFEKNFFGNSKTPDQKFILRGRDWTNLKRLIDGDLQEFSEWEKTIPTVDQAGLTVLISQHPDLFEKLLSNKNILKLSEASFESLDRLAIKLYEVKAERIDLILKALSATSSDDLTQFSRLLEDLRLNQVSTMASLVYQKLKVIDLLETTCTNPQKRERGVHDIFDKNSWLVGKQYEIVQSDRPLSKFMDENLPFEPDLKKRPDLILKVVPSSQDVVLVELKAPGVPLKADHIGQILTYRALIEKNKANVENVHCFVFGYEKSPSFCVSKDVVMKTFSELIAELRAEYREYTRIIESGKEIEADVDS
jgi:hypothetical protein